jgi:hypothetical protein
MPTIKINDLARILATYVKRAIRFYGGNRTTKDRMVPPDADSFRTAWHVARCDFRSPYDFRGASSGKSKDTRINDIERKAERRRAGSWR